MPFGIGLPDVLEDPLNKIPGVGGLIETDDEKKRRQKRQRDWERKHPRAPKGLPEDLQRQVDVELKKPKKQREEEKKRDFFGIPTLKPGELPFGQKISDLWHPGKTFERLGGDVTKWAHAPKPIATIPHQVGELGAGILPALGMMGKAAGHDISNIWQRPGDIGSTSDFKDFLRLAQWTYDEASRGHKGKNAAPPKTDSELGGLVAAMLGGWGRSVEKAIPNPTDPEDFREFKNYWSEHSVQAALDLYPLAAAISRPLSAASLGSRIGRMNPELTRAGAIKAGIKESYHPGSARRAGMQGGIETRTHTVDIGGEAVEVQGRPWSRIPIARAGQRGYDRAFLTEGAKRKRVAAAEQRAQSEAERLVNNEAAEMARPLAHVIYGRTGRFINSFGLKKDMSAAQRRRAMALSYAFQMPMHLEPAAAIEMVKKNLTSILESGHIEAVPKGGRTVKELPLDVGEKQRLIDQIADLEKVQAELRTGKIDEDEFRAGLEALKDFSDQNTEMGLEIMQRRGNLTDDQVDALRASWDERAGILPRWLSERGFFGGSLEGSAERQSRLAHFIEQYGEEEAHARIAASDGFARGMSPEDPAAWYRDRVGEHTDETAQDFMDRDPEDALLQVPFSLSRKVPEHVAEQNLRYVGPLLDELGNTIAEAGSLYKPHLGRQVNKKVYRSINGQRVQIIGRITPQEWVKRIKAVIPTAAERESLARWYEQVAPTFERFFGEDAEAILRGFTVSQANASPTSGLQATLRVFDKLKAGQEISPKEISAVVKSIEKAVEGEHVSSGLAAKLHDFADSIEGKDTRTWMGDDPRGGAPTANDIHAIRDLGYIDKKLVARLRNPEPGALFRKGIDDFEIDSGGSPGRHQYERMREQYTEITDHLNAIEFDGRKNWKPAEVQALGWSGIQRVHGAYPENLLDAVGNNTRRVELEVAKGADVTMEEAMNIARHLHGPVSDMIDDTDNLFLDSNLEVGIAGRGPASVATVQFNVIGSPEKAHALVVRLSEALGTDARALRTSSSTGSKPTLEIYADELADPELAQALYDDLLGTDKKRYVSFSTRVNDAGTPGIEIIMRGKAITEAETAAFEAGHRALLNETVDRVLGDVEYDYWSSNTQIIGKDWKGGKGNLQGPSRGKPGRAVPDHLAAAARKRHDSAIDQTRRARQGEGELTEKRKLYQRPNWDELPRGAVEFLDDERRTSRIHEFEGADVSTWIHELFHSAYHDLTPEARQIVNDYYAGGRDFDEWVTAEHENFAIDGEKFVKRGRAPTPGMRSVFRKLSRWVQQVWKEEKRRGGTNERKMPDELKDVFNRMFRDADGEEHSAWGYMPHRDIYEIARQNYTGGVRPPARGQAIGIATLDRKALERGSNELIRYQTGTLSPDPAHIVDVYLRRLRFKETLHARDELWSMGRSMADPPPQGTRVWLIRNPDAPADRILPAVRARAEGRSTTIESDAGALEDLEGKLSQPHDDIRKEMLAKPGEHPEWTIGDKNQPNVRWVPDDYVQRRFGEVFEEKPRGTMWSAAGLLTSLQRTSGIYGRPIAYIAGNIPFNTMALMASMPLSTLRNAPRALRMLREDPVLYRALVSEGGTSRAGAGLPSRRLPAQSKIQGAEEKATSAQRGLAEMLSHVADDPFRVTAFLNHAAKKGYKTRAELKELLTDEAAKSDLSDVRQLTRESMLDFDALNPSQRRIASNLMYLYPFIYASVKWPAMFAREYPARAAAVGSYAADIGAKEDQGNDISNLWLKHGIDIGTVNPVGPLADIAQTSTAFFKDPTSMDLSVLQDRVSPSIAAMVEAMSGGKKNALQNFIRGTIPGASEVYGKLDPQFRGNKAFADRSWESYMLARHLRFFPRGINPEVVKERIEQYRSDQMTVNTAEVARDQDWKKIEARYRIVGGDPEEIRRSFKSWWDYQEAVDEKKDSTGQRKLNAYQTLSILDEIIRDNFPERAPELWDLNGVDDQAYMKKYKTELDDYAEELKKIINAGREDLSYSFSGYKRSGSELGGAGGGAGGGTGGAGGIG